MKIYQHSFILLILFSLSCNSNQVIFEQNTPFNLLNITAQDWVSGVPGGDKGTYITFQVEQLPKNISLLAGYYKNQKVAIKAPLNNCYTLNFITPVKPDVIMDINPANEAQNIPNPEQELNLLDGEVVFKYKENNKIKFVKYTQITHNPLLAYPSSPPNNL